MISGDSEGVGAPYCQERLSQDSGDNVARSWSSLLSGALIPRFWRQCSKKLELPIVRSAYPKILETMEREVRVPGELSLLEVLVQVLDRRGR